MSLDPDDVWAEDTDTGCMSWNGHKGNWCHRKKGHDGLCATNPISYDEKEFSCYVWGPGVGTSLLSNSEASLSRAIAMAPADPRVCDLYLHAVNLLQLSRAVGVHDPRCEKTYILMRQAVDLLAEE